MTEDQARARHEQQLKEEAAEILGCRPDELAVGRKEDLLAGRLVPESPHPARVVSHVLACMVLVLLVAWGAGAALALAVHAYNWTTEVLGE